MFYENIIKVCKERGTTPTTALRECGFSTGNMSKWKKGSVPNIEMCLKLSEHLGVSLDYLLTLKNPSGVILSPSDQEWLNIISRIPEDKHPMLKDFLRTHMVIPEKYEGKKEA